MNIQECHQNEPISNMGIQIGNVYPTSDYSEHGQKESFIARRNLK